MRQLHRSLLTLCCLVHLAIARYTSTSAATTQHTQLRNSSRHLRASPLITAAIASERSRRREFSRWPEPEYTLPRETAIRTVRAPAAITPLSLARRPLIKREFPNFPRLGCAARREAAARTVRHSMHSGSCGCTGPGRSSPERHQARSDLLGGRCSLRARNIHDGRQQVARAPPDTLIGTWVARRPLNSGRTRRGRRCTKAENPQGSRRGRTIAINATGNP